MPCTTPIDDAIVTTTRPTGSDSLTVTLVGPLPPPFGGISVHLLRLQARLARRGVRVKTLAAGSTAPRIGNFETSVGNSPIRHLHGALTHFSGTVHVHNRISPLTFLLCQCARLRRCPLVLTLHGDPRNPLTRRPGVDAFLARSIRLADHVIAVNTHVAESIRRQADPGKLSVLPAYIRPSPDDEPGLDEHAAIWLGASDLPLVTFAAYRVLPPVFGKDVYGIDLVTRAVESLRDGAPFRLVLLLSVAPVDSRERDFLSSRVLRLRAVLGDRFATFCGVYAPPILARSTLFLRPSLADGDSLAIREALDLGIPVIASDAVPRPPGAVLHARGSADSLAERMVDGLSGRIARPAFPDGQDRVSTEIERIYEAVSVRHHDRSSPETGL